MQIEKRRVSDNRCQCCKCVDENRLRDKKRDCRKKLAYAENPNKFRERSKQWHKANPEKCREIKHRRRASELNATPAWYGELDEFVLMQAYELCQMRKECSGVKWQIDHMIPLQAKNVCGLHVWNNFQVIPACVNAAKRNKMIYTQPNEWLREFTNE